MNVSANDLIAVLPPFNNNSVLIETNQGIPDIIKEVLEAHQYFAGDYDFIWRYFDRSTIEETCKALFTFCKKNIRYVVESEDEQTTKSPGALLAIGSGDCKHYAGFIAGVLSAIKRHTGKNIKWVYRFSSYSFFLKEPGHVFVVVFDRGKELWIDPVLSSFNERLQPVYIVDKKAKDMPLYRISGPEQEQDILPDLVYEVDSDDGNLSPQLIRSIHLLLSYGVLDTDGNVNDSFLQELSNTIPSNDYNQLLEARLVLNDAAIAGFFQDIWRGVKKVTLAVPRGAFLALVSLNVFGLATKMKEASKDTAGANEIRNRWYKFGGDWAKLRGAISQGATKKRIMGIGEPVTLAAVIASASAIIAALMPVINAILNKQKQNGTLDPNFDQALLNNSGLPDDQKFDLGQWIKDNLLLVAAGSFLIINFVVLPPNRRLIKI